MRWCSKCDNMAVVKVLNKGYSRYSNLMHLMRTLFSAAAKYNFWFVVSHLPGARNVAADIISRDNLGVLFAQAPDIHHICLHFLCHSRLCFCT